MSVEYFCWVFTEGKHLPGPPTITWCQDCYAANGQGIVNQRNCLSTLEALVCAKYFLSVNKPWQQMGHWQTLLCSYWKTTSHKYTYIEPSINSVRTCSIITKLMVMSQQLPKSVGSFLWKTYWLKFHRSHWLTDQSLQADSWHATINLQKLSISMA